MSQLDGWAGHTGAYIIYNHISLCIII
jgi:hypothetical protein